MAPASSEVAFLASPPKSGGSAPFVSPGGASHSIHNDLSPHFSGALGKAASCLPILLPPTQLPSSPHPPLPSRHWGLHLGLGCQPQAGPHNRKTGIGKHRKGEKPQKSGFLCLQITGSCRSEAVLATHCPRYSLVLHSPLQPPSQDACACVCACPYWTTRPAGWQRTHCV